LRVPKPLTLYAAFLYSMVTDNAIVLHSRRYADTSRIVVLLTETLGKVSVVAKGSRTPKSKVGGALEPLSLCRVSIYHRKNRELHTLGMAELTSVWKRNHTSFEHLQAGMIICRQALRTLPAEVSAPEIYEHFKVSLQQLDAVLPEEAYPHSVRVRVHLTHLLGFGLHPELLQRDEKLMKGAWVYVDVADGRIVGSSGYPLTVDSLQLLTADSWTSGQVPVSVQTEVDGFLSRYFAHHLGGHSL